MNLLWKNQALSLLGLKNESCSYSAITKLICGLPFIDVIAQKKEDFQKPR